MKKLCILFVVFTATVSLMAQQHGAMNFIGTGTFYVPSMKDQSLTTNIKDTVVVEMTENNTASITLPKMVYTGLGSALTVNPFTVSGASWSMDMATFVSSWPEQSFTTTTIGIDGFEKSITGTLQAAYIHSSGAFELTVTFNYGSMPFPLTYESTGYYTVSNAWGLAGRGTAKNPYKIYDAADFAALAANFSDTNDGSNEYFVMMNDVDFGGSAESPAQLPAIGKKYITNVNSVTAGFNGSFDGQDHVISGIYHTRAENNTDGKFNALFSSVDSAGVIKNLTFAADNYIMSYNYAAPFASLSQGTIENCTNNADLTAANYAGAGIVGHIIKGKGSIVNCTNNGNITAMTYAAGIVGGSQSGSSVSATASGYLSVIENCTNNGTVMSTNGTGSAGIVGVFTGSIRNCTNFGTVDDSQSTAKSRMYTAGIVASASYILEIDNCTNKGTVAGGRMVGGVLAQVAKGDDADITITNCFNYGSVTADSIVGGVAGNTARVNGVVTLESCENYGTVTATGNANLSGNLRGNAAIVIGSNCKIGSELTKLPLDPDETAIHSIVNEDEDEPVAFDLSGRRFSGKGLKIQNGKVVFSK